MDAKVEELEIIQNTDNNGYKENQSGDKISGNVSNCSGHQDSFDSSSRGRQYASFSFKFQSRPSLGLSSYMSEDELWGKDQFFDDEVIFERKVQPKDVKFRNGCLSDKFIHHATSAVYHFCQQANQASFQTLLLGFSSPDTSILTDKPQNSEIHVLSQYLQDLFYRKQHTFLIYTFDWSLCHLSFMCCMLIYWMQVQMGEYEDVQPFNKKKQEYIRGQKIKLKQNICYVALSYAQQRSQQLNINQPVLLLIYYFMNFMKKQQCLNIVEISLSQDKLINDIKLFRRIKRKEKEFQSTVNAVVFESQLKKYEHENKFTVSFEKTHTLLNFICQHNFVSRPLLYYYQLDELKGGRKDYQMKKQGFCLWVLNIVLNECSSRKVDSLHNSAMYIITFMAILKLMKESCNLEGVSYILPIIINIKHHLPKLWKFVSERRGDIEGKLNEYQRNLIHKDYRTGQISQDNAIIWGQTIFDISQKMSRMVNNKNGIILQEHRRFYEEFLVHLLHYRRNIQKEYKQEIAKYNEEKQIGSSFNMYLLDSYVSKMYGKKNMEKEWGNFVKRAQLINNGIQINLYSNIINYCFIGSTAKIRSMEI